MSSSDPSSSRGALGAIAFGLVAATLLLLQIVLSRLFAGTLTYYYAFMLISLAMLGLAAGGLAVYLWPRLFPEDAVWERAAWFSAGTGIATFAGTLGVLAFLPFVTFGADRFHLANPWALAAVFWCCFPPLLLGGIVVSGVLASRRSDFHRFYAVDLTSAAAGCVLALTLLASATPVEVLLEIAAVLPAAAAVLFALQAGARRQALGALGLAAGLALVGSWLAADVRLAKPPHLAWRDRREIVSEWNASSAVRVYPWRFFSWALSPDYRGPAFPMLDLIIDGIGGTPIVRFDGRAESLADYAYLDQDMTALPHHLVAPAGRQLVIGPGGGVDLLQAVRAGRRDVTAVEINPLIERVVNEDLAEFSGSPYRLPGVSVVIDNGRTFVKRSTETWELITLTWVDTGGSAAALALSENYLYTVEAFSEYLDRLSSQGMVAFLRAWGESGLRVDSMRGVAVAVESLLRRGVTDPGRHLLISAVKSPAFTRPMCLVLVARSPFSEAQIARAQAFLSERSFVPVWLPDGSVELASVPERFREIAGILHRAVRGPDRETFYREAAFDLAPSTDDNPFYFVERGGPNRQAGIGVRQLAVYTLILAVLVVPFLILPLLPTLRVNRPLDPFGRRAIAYFSLLGLSFMLVEIEFFHLFALLLGKPTLTLAVVLSSLLVFSGLGSLFGGRVADGPPSQLILLFALLAGALALFVGSREAILAALVPQPLSVRVAGTALVIAPIAFAMGMPMPAGMRLIRHRRELMLWGWAMNGALSVFASVAAIYLAIYFGIARAFAVGLAGYVLAGVLAVRLRARRDDGPLERSVV